VGRDGWRRIRGGEEWVGARSSLSSDWVEFDFSEFSGPDSSGEGRKGGGEEEGLCNEPNSNDKERQPFGPKGQDPYSNKKRSG